MFLYLVSPLFLNPPTPLIRGARHLLTDNTLFLKRNPFVVGQFIARSYIPLTLSESRRTRIARISQIGFFHRQRTYSKEDWIANNKEHAILSRRTASGVGNPAYKTQHFQKRGAPVA